MAVWAENERDLADPKVRFGSHIRALRLYADLSPSQVCAAMRKAGHKQWRENLFGNVQTGARIPHWDELPHLAQILGVTLDELLAPVATPIPDGAVPEAWDPCSEEIVGLAKVFNAPPAEIVEVLCKHFSRDIDLPAKPTTVTVRVGAVNPDTPAGKPDRTNQLKFAGAPGDRERIQALLRPTGARSEAALIRRMVGDALTAYEAQYRPGGGGETTNP